MWNGASANTDASVEVNGDATSILEAGDYIMTYGGAGPHCGLDFGKIFRVASLTATHITLHTTNAGTADDIKQPLLYFHSKKNLQRLIIAFIVTFIAHFCI